MMDAEKTTDAVDILHRHYVEGDSEMEVLVKKSGYAPKSLLKSTNSEPSLAYPNGHWQRRAVCQHL